MQLGSGTFDLEPSLAYGNHSEQWSCEAIGYATLRLGSNSHDYTLGNRFSWITPFVELGFQVSGEIDGVDNDLKVPLRKIGPAGPVSDENGNPVFETTTDGAGNTVPVPGISGPSHQSRSFRWPGTGLGDWRKNTVDRKYVSANQLRYPGLPNLNGPQPKEFGRFDLGWSWSFSHVYLLEQK